MSYNNVVTKFGDSDRSIYTMPNLTYKTGQSIKCHIYFLLLAYCNAVCLFVCLLGV